MGCTEPSKFPLFSDIPVSTVTLKAGEVLYIPPYHFHRVVASSPSISVNVWFDSQETVILELLEGQTVPVDIGGPMMRTVESVLGYVDIILQNLGMNTEDFLTRYRMLRWEKKGKSGACNPFEGKIRRDSQAEWDANLVDERTGGGIYPALVQMCCLDHRYRETPSETEAICVTEHPSAPIWEATAEHWCEERGGWALTERDLQGLLYPYGGRAATILSAARTTALREMILSQYMDMLLSFFFSPESQAIPNLLLS